jgi:hypothetical protein
MQYKKVKDLTMYQVATDRHYKVGDILKFGSELNGQGKRALQESYKEYDFAIRELAVEAARKTVDKSLPSRFTCMFVTDKREYATDGLTTFHTKNRGGKYWQAVTVKLNGKLFCGYGQHNVLRSGSYEEYYNSALVYWTGKTAEQGQEFLFEGTAEITEIFGEFSISKKSVKN